MIDTDPFDTLSEVERVRASSGRRPWEPFTLAVGQHVRVRLSAECQEHQTRHESDVLRLVDGVTGVLRATDDPREPNHPYDVQFSEGVEIGRPVHGWIGLRRGVDVVVIGGLFALAELIPLGTEER